MKSYFLTGTSTGIGKDAALKLDQLGNRVFAGVRSQKDALLLKKNSTERLIPVIVDITDDKSVKHSLATISEILGTDSLDGLVNNAGIVVSGPLEFLEIKDFQNQLDVNITGQLRVIQALLPLLRKSQGRIVNVGSVSGKLAIPFVGPYCVSKFGMRALNNSLRLEVLPWNISVSLIEPGPINTPIWEKSKLAAKLRFEKMGPRAYELYKEGMSVMEKAVAKSARDAVPVSLVTKAIVHALTSAKPKASYRIGVDAHVQNYLARFLPDKLLGKVILKGMDL